MDSRADAQAVAPAAHSAAALAALMKTQARLAPHARHDLVGAASPLSMDLSLLGVKSRKAPLESAEVAPFVERGHDNVKKTLQQCDRLVLFLAQDPAPRVAVAELMDRLARKMRTVFGEIAHEPQADLGEESEYELTLAAWAALMALADFHGPDTRLTLAAHREGAGLTLSFAAEPLAGEAAAWAGAGGEIAAAQRLTLDEARAAALHLGFALDGTPEALTLARSAQAA